MSLFIFAFALPNYSFSSLPIMIDLQAQTIQYSSGLVKKNKRLILPKGAYIEESDGWVIHRKDGRRIPLKDLKPSGTIMPSLSPDESLIAFIQLVARTHVLVRVWDLTTGEEKRYPG